MFAGRTRRYVGEILGGRFEGGAGMFIPARVLFADSFVGTAERAAVPGQCLALFLFLLFGILRDRGNASPGATEWESEQDDEDRSSGEPHGVTPPGSITWCANKNAL